MELHLQSKLLRVLQEKEFERVGSNKSIKTDCRIIVATNKNLKEEVKKNKFREDLYYRLQGLPVDLPPLRERKSDILILASHFLQNFCRENKIELRRIGEQAQKKLLGYSFPGNIRELKSLIELAVTLSSDTEITPSDIVINSGDLLAETITSDLTLREYELKIIKASLLKNNNDIKVTAGKLGIGVSTIYRILKEERQN
jgi:DNA-binding NtrC family response regulator